MWMVLIGGVDEMCRQDIQALEVLRAEHGLYRDLEQVRTLPSTPTCPQVCAGNCGTRASQSTWQLVSQEGHLVDRY